MPKMTLDQNYKAVQAPTIRTVISSGPELTPDNDMLVTLGADVTLTVDGNSVNLLQAFTFVLCSGVTYTFSESVALGVA